MPRRDRWCRTPQRGRARLQSGRESGAVAVEFAIILPLLGMLLLGIITFGLAFSDKVALANAVREGARFGASTDQGPSWGGDVAQRTVDIYANADNPLSTGTVCAQLILFTAPSTYTVERTSDTDCGGVASPAGPAPNPPANIPDRSCFVKVWATQPANLNWLVTSTTVTLGADSVSVYDRTCS